MPDLLWECWREDTFEIFGLAGEELDKSVARLCPNAKRAMKGYASSNIDARKQYEMASVGEGWEPSEEVEVHVYTDDDAATQVAYLKQRDVR